MGRVFSLTLCFSLHYQSEIKLLSTSVFVDPYEEADAQVSICMQFHICCVFMPCHWSDTVCVFRLQPRERRKHRNRRKRERKLLLQSTRQKQRTSLKPSDQEWANTSTQLPREFTHTHTHTSGIMPSSWIWKLCNIIRPDRSFYIAWYCIDLFQLSIHKYFSCNSEEVIWSLLK